MLQSIDLLSRLYDLLLQLLPHIFFIGNLLFLSVQNLINFACMVYVIWKILRFLRWRHKTTHIAVSKTEWSFCSLKNMSHITIFPLVALVQSLLLHSLNFVLKILKTHHWVAFCCTIKSMFFWAWRKYTSLSLCAWTSLYLSGFFQLILVIWLLFVLFWATCGHQSAKDIVTKPSNGLQIFC